ncbi:hypothetical protein QYE76_006032 [Lolium multiflorum]|uniref:Uncharacterized protein n=1 Tax=Lolium multiflorum TaxID=4521 RepID=A0AAD8RVM9_LOLMU|nr:hypothetical protein QYE76_006032 [Lolium multiflorum]
MSNSSLPSDSESEGKPPGWLHWWETPATLNDPGSTPRKVKEDGGTVGSDSQEEEDGGAVGSDSEEEEDSDAKFARLEALEAANEKARKGRRQGRRHGRRRRRRVVVRSPTTTTRTPLRPPGTPPRTRRPAVPLPRRR